MQTKKENQDYLGAVGVIKSCFIFFLVLNFFIVVNKVENNKIYHLNIFKSTVQQQ